MDVEWLAEELTGDQWFNKIPPLLIVTGSKQEGHFCNKCVTRKKDIE